MPKIEHPEKIKSLAMLKMEKNFLAVLEKGYPRKPYQGKSLSFWIGRIREETKELENEVVLAHEPDASMKTRLKALNDAKVECADISNIVDYLFEALSVLCNLEDTGDCPFLIKEGFMCGLFPRNRCMDVIHLKFCTWGKDETQKRKE